jgi:hypothetical protein
MWCYLLHPLFKSPWQIPGQFCRAINDRDEFFSNNWIHKRSWQQCGLHKKGKALEEFIWEFLHAHNKSFCALHHITCFFIWFGWGRWPALTYETQEFGLGPKTSCNNYTFPLVYNREDTSMTKNWESLWVDLVTRQIPASWFYPGYRLGSNWPFQVT